MSSTGTPLGNWTLELVAWIALDISARLPDASLPIVAVTALLGVLSHTVVPAPPTVKTSREYAYEGFDASGESGAGSRGAADAVRMMDTSAMRMYHALAMNSARMLSETIHRDCCVFMTARYLLCPDAIVQRL